MVKQICYCVHSTIESVWQNNCFPLIVIVCILATCGANTLCGNTCTGKDIVSYNDVFRRLMGNNTFCSASKCALKTPLLIVPWIAQPACHQICLEIGISVFIWFHFFIRSSLTKYIIKDTTIMRKNTFVHESWGSPITCCLAPMRARALRALEASQHVIGL